MIHSLRSIHFLYFFQFIVLLSTSLSFRSLLKISFYQTEDIKVGHGRRVTSFSLGLSLWRMQGRPLVRGSIITKVKRDVTPREQLCCALILSGAVKLPLWIYFSMLNTDILLSSSPTSTPHVHHSLWKAAFCCLKSGHMLLPKLCNLDNGEGNWEDLPSQDSLCALGRPPISSADCCPPYDSGRTCPL